MAEAHSTESDSEDPLSVHQRFQELYPELLEVAERMLRSKPGHSLVPRELVSEAFLKLTREEARRREDGRSELGERPDPIFRACFGRACRDVLSNRYRKKKPLLRLESSFDGADLTPSDLIAKDLLSRLGRNDKLAEAIVEMRVFSGLSVSECASTLRVSDSTVDRRSRFAFAWLRRELRDGA